jgi:hypothetical protein
MSDKPTYPASTRRDRLGSVGVAAVDMDPPPPLLVLPGGAGGGAGHRDGDGGRLPAAVGALLDRADGADAASRARALDASADDYLDGQRPTNTEKGYTADWRRWQGSR